MALGLIWQGTQLRKSEAASQKLRAEAAQLSELRGEAERLRQITVDKGELDRLRDSETALKGAEIHPAGSECAAL
jgi:hypothetical protein